MKRSVLTTATAAGAISLALATSASAPAATSSAPESPQAATNAKTFGMVRSTAAEGANCVPYAKATVKITPLEGAERMDVNVSGLPANTGFDLFVLQVPDAPFGMAWYQGDIETDANGKGHGRFIGRFNIETFSVAVGTAPAPVVHDSPIADASTNPQTAPVHQYHLGLWFNSPIDAAAAGCPNAVTPFNGEHNAGVQVLSTKNFPIDAGPLKRVPA
ncbi:MAG: hypothetical protein ACOYBY_15880 [Dermatophilaceae bacterium]